LWKVAEGARVKEFDKEEVFGGVGVEVLLTGGYDTVNGHFSYAQVLAQDLTLICFTSITGPNLASISRTTAKV
jgi:hypothetical protein